MILNDTGMVAQRCWLAIPEHFPDVVLHEYVVMPDHVHGIIQIVRTNIGSVGVKNFSPRLTNHHPIPMKSPSRTVGSIIRGFKIGVTKWCRENRSDEYPIGHAVWQRNYHDHIIRDDPSYDRISNYILNNPKKWEDDKFHRHSGE